MTTPTRLSEILALLPSPFERSKTKRTKAIRDARRVLADYQRALSAGLAQETRVRLLLWAEAYIQEALYQETHARIGYHHQQPSGVVAQQLRLRGEI